MDLVTLVTACALAVDPKLMHALVWHQSGGEPWAVSVQGERSPRVYAGMDDAIREARASPIGSVVRVGLAGLSVPPSRVTASVLLPCRNVAMAAAQIAKHASRCKTHPRLKRPTRPSVRSLSIAAPGSSRTSISRPTLRHPWPRATPPISTCHGARVRRFSIQRPIRRPTQTLPSSPLPLPPMSVCGAGQARFSQRDPIGWRANPRAARLSVRLQSNHLCHVCPQRLQQKAMRRTVTCLCAAQAWAFHDGARREAS